MPKISIIIPCYNSFNLMGRCFKSLEKQTYKDFEVLVIDDCSKDSSYQDLIGYKKTAHLKMEVLKTEINSGPGPARNIGIKRSSGQYITFLDSDDWVEPDWLDSIVNILENDNSIDCMLFDYYLHRRNIYKHLAMVENCKEGYTNRSEALIFSKGSTWGKIYKANVIKENNIGFPDIRRNEDMPFNKIALASCGRIYYLKKPLYHYIVHSESLMHNKAYHTEKNAIKAFNLIYEKLNSKLPDEIEGIFIKELLYATVLRMAMLRRTHHEIIEHIEKYETMYPDWSNNPIIGSFEKHVQIVLYFIKHRYIWGVRGISFVKSVLK